MNSKNRKQKRNFRLLRISMIAAILLTGTTLFAQQYDTIQWNTLKNYKTPEWFQDAKFGIYPHWGVYSVPASYKTISTTFPLPSSEASVSPYF